MVRGAATAGNRFLRIIYVKIKYMGRSYNIWMLVFVLGGLSLVTCKQYTGDWAQQEVALKGSNTKLTYMIPDDIPSCKEVLVAAGAGENVIAEHCNRYRNLYFVLIQHDKPSYPEGTPYSPFDTFAKACLDRLMNDGAVSSEMKILEQKKDTLSNGVITSTAELFGYMGEDNPIFYFHTALDVGDFFIEASAWTRGEKRRLEHGDRLRRIISSIKVNSQ